MKFEENGYVGYKVTLSDKSSFTVYDNGNIIN